MARKVIGGAKWIFSGIRLWLITAISVAQELPSGGGAIPALRRGAGGEIELAPSGALPRREADRPNPAVGARTLSSPGRRVEARPASPAQPQLSPEPVITVTPVTPRVP